MPTIFTTTAARNAAAALEAMQALDPTKTSVTTFVMESPEAMDYLRKNSGAIGRLPASLKTPADFVGQLRGVDQITNVKDLVETIHTMGLFGAVPALGYVIGPPIGFHPMISAMGITFLTKLIWAKTESNRITEAVLFAGYAFGEACLGLLAPPPFNAAIAGSMGTCAVDLITRVEGLVKKDKSIPLDFT